MNGAKSKLIIRGGRVLDPGQGIDLVGDVLISDGRIAAVGAEIKDGGARVIDAKGAYRLPRAGRHPLPFARPRFRVQGDD